MNYLFLVVNVMCRCHTIFELRFLKVYTKALQLHNKSLSESQCSVYSKAGNLFLFSVNKTLLNGFFPPELFIAKTFFVMK